MHKKQKHLFVSFNYDFTKHTQFYYNKSYVCLSRVDWEACSNNEASLFDILILII